MASTRIDHLRKALRTHDLEAVVVTHLPHIHYLSGFNGSAGMLAVSQDDAVLVTDFRYELQAAEQTRDGVRPVIFDNTAGMLATIKSEMGLQKGMALGVQDAYLTLAAAEEMKRAWRGVKFTNTGAMVRDLTMVKTEEEIGKIKRAADIAAKVFRSVLTIVRPGMRENELAAEISYQGRKLGAQDDAFDIIVASGPRGALPHGRASAKKIRKGELVTLDFGFTVDGFNSDMTRTFAVGEPGEEARRIYDIVLRAEQAGVRAARAGITGYDLDEVCRSIIREEGYGERFGHSTGHGLGIEVHEMPSVSFRQPSYTLEPGMVVTIEPGIYLPDHLGVRIEDDVAITADGCRVLTSAPRKLIVV